MSDGKRVVWVLGAGFSVPLGGPMLKDLLSLESRRDIEDKHPLSDDPGVYWLYHYGRKFEDGWLSNQDPIAPGESLWQHAEDYLQQLDTAAHNPDGVLARRLRNVLASYQRRWRTLNGQSGVNAEVDLLAVAAQAKRYVAAECINFVEKTEPGYEHWGPYHDWASKLGSQDVIVTFNYDTVLEQVAGKELVPILDSDDWDKHADRSARVLKLHGSVNWRWDRSAQKITRKTKDFAEKCKPEELAIATPGPSKQDAVAEKLAELWAHAEEALAAADVVVFIGYRFPPTDAYARARLLGAIRRNDLPHVDLHLVLGPKQSTDSIRLSRLLEMACSRRFRIGSPGVTVNRKTFRLTREPLWGQDFLDMWERDQLFRSH